MNALPPRSEHDARRAGIRRTAWIVAASATAIYVAFMFMALSR